MYVETVFSWGIDIQKERTVFLQQILRISVNLIRY